MAALRLPPALASLAAEVPAAGPALAEAYYELVHERCGAAAIRRVAAYSQPAARALQAAQNPRTTLTRVRREDAVAFLAAMEARRAERDQPESQQHVVGWCGCCIVASRSRRSPSQPECCARCAAGSCTRR